MGPTEILLGVAFPVIIGVGVALALSDASAAEFRVARGCFILAALEIAAFALYWLRSSDRPLAPKLIAAAFLGAFALAGTVGAVSWVDFREALKNQKPAQAEAARQTPDVALRFVYPKSPALIFVNQSSVIAREIKWTVVLWNMDLPDRNDPLPIPIGTFDWIKPHDEGGPQNLFGGPLVAPLLKPGNRLFGSASVTCPECSGGRTYIVYIVWDEGGWVSEVERNEQSGKVLLPPNALKPGRIEYFKALEAMAPAESRTPIAERDGRLDKQGRSAKRPEPVRSYVGSAVTAACAAFLRPYGLVRVRGDRFGVVLTITEKRGIPNVPGNLA